MNLYRVLLLLPFLYIGVVDKTVANESFEGELVVEQWWADSKIDGNREDKESSLSFYGSIETDLLYIPDFKIRYSTVDVNYAELDKIDYVFYYNLLDHPILTFDLGLALSHYYNSQYQNKLTGEGFDFDGTILNLYANGSINIPNTNLDIIGQFDFSDRNDKKMADFTAGLRYHLPIETIKISLRGGYRVMDYTFFEDKEKEATVFVDGWFIGLQSNF